ncbi:hypothetical protein Tco_1031807 [Tanacetum coccineum]|uniref:Uncharacterized protein n=1 Tax=Tanacetum coccineum TaxID=301880 RepID=A0ABQ5GBE8_9ASTR
MSFSLLETTLSFYFTMIHLYALFPFSRDSSMNRLPENESFSLDHFDDPSLPRPPPEPPDVEICFDFKPDTGDFINKVVGDISEHDVLMPNLLPTQPTLCPVFDLLLPFSSENEDKVFKPGIFSSPFLSHRAKITFDFSESPMMIFGGDIPHLDVPYLHFYPP